MGVNLFMVMNCNQSYKEKEQRGLRENDRENGTVAKLIFLKIKSDHI